MDPKTNPFAPGAGTRPPELAGRESILTNAEVALARLRKGLPARGQLLLGLRGVGKTVLLNRIAAMADELAYRTVVLEAPEERDLADMIVPPLRKELFQLSRLEKAKDVARRALGVLRGFARAFKVRVGDVEFEVEAEKGTADSGNLEADLPELLLSVTRAAKEGDSAVALFIDEVQYLQKTDLAALIVSTHKLAQRGLPFVLFGAGLPQLAALAGEAKSYAERLFDYPSVGPLDAASARDAIATPVRRQGAEIGPAALELIIERTRGYPYFLQEWGYHAWNAAPASPITPTDAEAASGAALRAMDEGFFRVRFDRLTPREKDYLRAMAELGEGPHRSGDIAELLAMTSTGAGPLRDGLIKKGMIYSPRYGDNGFTVPMFDEFMKRAMPHWERRQPPARRRRRTRDGSR